VQTEIDLFVSDAWEDEYKRKKKGGQERQVV